jgi:hypothetical protein
VSVPGETGAPARGRQGAGLFWAALLAFVAVDASLATRAYAGPLLAWALLAAFALSLAYVTALVSVSIGRRRWPAAADVARAAILAGLTVGHLLLIARARR